MPRTQTPTADDTWLPLGRASRLVGVDPDTLRRWADEGRVEVYLTPGGHRRFQRRSLERMVRSRSRERVRISRLGAPEEKLVAAYRRTYRAGNEHAPGPVQAIPESDRDAFRQNGRQLVAALVEHLDHDGAPRRAALVEARDTAHELGVHLAGSGASLTEAVALFVAARKPFMSELGALARRRALDSRQVSMLFDQASAALDQCLLSFVDGHQSVA
ncbi:MAG: helix-turn-helix domain-containing protein [Candidatus Limnocylindrales bacterium]